MGHKITRSQLLTEAIQEEPAISFTIDEFEEYKIICIEDGALPAPTFVDQNEYVSFIETIGRDKYMERPTDARAEELHHAHMWQEGCSWGEGENLLVQWDCTSDSYVVYSYFVDRDSDHHIHIIDFCKDRAHALIEDRVQVQRWTDQAKQHRLQNI